MAYERQFFTKGQVLTAEEMNELDAWLAHICGREITAAETNSRGELVFTFRDGGTLNVGEVGGVNAAELTEAVEKALQEAKDSGEFDGDPGEPGLPGASGVYVGTGTPTDNAVVWVNPIGEPTATEDWEFDLDDGNTDTKTVVVIGSDDATNQGKVAILRMKDADGNWVEIPAIKGVSPVVKVSKSGKVTTITITDADGVKTAAINDGFDPVVETTKSGKVTTVKITDASGTKTATINDGADGYTPQKGKDYFDGTSVTVAKVTESTASGGTNVVEFSDGKSLNVKNGKDGYTPQKNVDYFDGDDYVLTDADKANIAEKVKQSITPESIGAAKVQSPNDMLHNGNEFTFIPDGYEGQIYINHRTASGQTNGNVSNYYFGNGKGGLATFIANYFKGKFQGDTERLNYNNEEVAMLTDVPTKTDTWTAVYEDGTVETIEVFIK